MNRPVENRIFQSQIQKMVVMGILLLMLMSMFEKDDGMGENPDK